MTATRQGHDALLVPAATPTAPSTGQAPPEPLHWRWRAGALAAGAELVFVLGPWALAGYAIAFEGANAWVLAIIASISPMQHRLARASVDFIRTGGGELDDRPDRLEHVLEALQRFRAPTEKEASDRLEAPLGDDALGAEEGAELADE